MEKTLKIKLSVSEWNTIISTLSLVPFDPAKEVLEKIKTQAENINKEEQEIEFEFTVKQLETILNIVKLGRYIDVFNIISEIFKQSKEQLK